MEGRRGVELFLLRGNVMKRLMTVLFLTILWSLSAQEIKVLKIEGKVKYKESSAGEWLDVKEGQLLKTGFLIYTGFDSRAILQTPGAKIEVKELSQTTIEALLATEESVITDIHLKYGQIKADVQSSENSKTIFNVRSANSTASVRGTIFTFGDDRLFVEDGFVTLSNDYGEEVLARKDDRAYSPSFSTIATPYQHRFERYYVNFNPLGLSSGERRLRRFLGTRSGGVIYKAKVIINIKVIL